MSDLTPKITEQRKFDKWLEDVQFVVDPNPNDKPGIQVVTVEAVRKYFAVPAIVEVEGLRELSEKATPGEWRGYPNKAGKLIQERKNPHGEASNWVGRVRAMRGPGNYDIVFDLDFGYGDTAMEHDAAFVIACVNYVRSALAAAVPQVVSVESLRESKPSAEFDWWWRSNSSNWEQVTTLDGQMILAWHSWCAALYLYELAQKAAAAPQSGKGKKG